MKNRKIFLTVFGISFVLASTASAACELLISKNVTGPGRVYLTQGEDAMTGPRVDNYSAKYGTRKKLIVEANEGSRFVRASGCGGHMSEKDEKYWTGYVTENCTVDALFRAGATNTPPVVTATENQTVEPGAQVVLTGTASDDGVIISVKWSKVIASSTETLSFGVAGPLEATFTAPAVENETAFGFEFTALDDEGVTTTKEVVITVKPKVVVTPPVDTGGYDFVFEDDFNDGIDDVTKWSFGNTPHQEADGKLRIRIDQTDRGRDGASTVEIPELSKFKMSLRHFMHPGSANYLPGISVKLKNGKEFSLAFPTSSYMENNCNSPEFTNKIILSSVPWGGRCYGSSGLTSADYYDKWVTSVVLYNATSGEFTLDLGGDGMNDFSATMPEEFRSPVAGFNFNTYGWYTGHYAEFDSVKVEGVKADSSGAQIEIQMIKSRVWHTSTRLNDNTVLLVGGDSDLTGSAELFDPSTRKFVVLGGLNDRRGGHAATLLRDGSVLITGGGDYSRTAEVYDPKLKVFKKVGDMINGRTFFSSVLLNDGKVLILGGYGRDSNGDILWGQASAEVYDPITEKFTSAGDMTEPRCQQVSVMLKNNKVLIAGGFNASSGTLSSAEIYDPDTRVFSPISGMFVPRRNVSGVMLGNGDLLITGGAQGNTEFTESAEIYTASSGVFKRVGDMSEKHWNHRMVSVGDGDAYVFGGNSGVEGYIHDSVEKYSSSLEIFTKTSNMKSSRTAHSATVLNNGSVLLSGGVSVPQDSTGGVESSTAEVYVP